MTTGDELPSTSLRDDWRLASPRQRKWLLVWLGSLIVASVVAGFWLVAHRRGELARTAAHNSGLMGENASQTEPARTPPAGHEQDIAMPVTAGIYLNRVPTVSLAEGTWSVDFYIWFSWVGAELDPGETFAVVDGEILGKTLIERAERQGRQYARYYVQATISKPFDGSRFPRDEHLLTIAIEDQKRQSYQQVFVPDTTGTVVSSRVAVHGYELGAADIKVRAHGYKSRMGDPGLPDDYRATYSQLVFGVMLQRHSWGIFWRLFLALYISVGLALLGLLLHSVGERLAMAGTALFVAIINAETIAPLVPETASATFVDIVNAVGYVAICIVIVQGIISQRYFAPRAQRRHASHLFDILTLAVVTAAYVGLNIAVLAAT
ncbi:MAG: hypothetical protein IPL79_17060 [Myxococcales bacterium]|nr:hypothetical protein [Myxococcales bacterium]